MSRTFHHLTCEHRDGCCCVRLCSTRLDEVMLRQLFQELHTLAREEGCRRLALSLGPEAPQCLYSVFLAKLITLQRILRERGGDLLLCEASESVRSIFAACRLEALFHFVPDFAAAVQAPVG